MPSAPRARRYALTFFTLPDFTFDESIIRYFVAGHEICPETKKHHWQAYIELFKPCSLKKVKQIVDDRKVHVEICKGTAQDNIEYCKKDGVVYREEGKPAAPGTRTDIHSLRDHFKNKKRLQSAVESDELVTAVAKFPRFVNTLQLLYSPQRDFITELYVLWGVPGSGKSHRAFSDAKQLGRVYFKPAGPWWDGYEGQESAIFEDFRGETGLAMLLRLADRYPLRVPVKGGFREFTSRRIYITSNLDTCDWFNTEARGYDVSMAALARRITKKTHYPVPYQQEKEKEATTDAIPQAHPILIRQ